MRRDKQDGSSGDEFDKTVGKVRRRGRKSTAASNVVLEAAALGDVARALEASKKRFGGGGGKARCVEAVEVLNKGRGSFPRRGNGSGGSTV